jgi:hypothetical protein
MKENKIFLKGRFGGKERKGWHQGLKGREQEGKCE